MHKRRGFTLIELMISVAIIGILTGMASLAYSTVNQRSRDSQRINDLNQLKIGLVTYYTAQSSPAYVTASTIITLNGSTDALSTALKPGYIKDVPTDPSNTGIYVYKYVSGANSRSFTLYGTLENKNDKKGWAGGSAWVQDGLRVTDS